MVRVSLKVTPGWGATKASQELRQDIEHVVTNIPDWPKGIGQKFKRWVSANVTLDLGAMRQFGISAGGPDRLCLNDAFRRNGANRKTNLVTFELGKVLYLAKSPETTFQSIWGEHPRAMAIDTLKLAALHGENLAFLFDLDGASYFGYAVRVAVLNLPSPAKWPAMQLVTLDAGQAPGTAATDEDKADWERAKHEMQNYLIKLLH